MPQPIPFNNETKAVDPFRPMHRVQSPSYSLDKAPPSGNGYACGCRKPSDYNAIPILAEILALPAIKAGMAVIPLIGPILTGINQAIAGVTGVDLQKELAKLLMREGEKLLFARHLRSVPTWVPVGRNGYDENFKETPIEVEGQLSHSFQTVRDLPHLQWSRWYKWAFHVHPARGYEHLIGAGNVLTQVEVDRLNENDANHAELTNDPGHIVLAEGHTRCALECVVDTGTFFRTPGNRQGDKLGMIPGLMFHPNWPFWPVARDYFWCRGRFVYDCSHVTTTDANGLHPTTINPVSMFAFARREGFKFDDNRFHTPAIRFQFFASRKGAYVDTEVLGGGDPKNDPVFILDLPDGGGMEEMSWAIHHSEKVGGNTLVLRPRLLRHLQTFPYGIPQDEFPPGFVAKGLEPVIEILRPRDPTLLPQQVKVTVPLSKLSSDTDACGFVLTLGWFDPDDAQADRVKKVTFRYDRIRDVPTGRNLRFRLACNGRYQFFHINDSVDVLDLRLPPFVLHLIDDQEVNLYVHAFRRRGFGEYFEKPDDKRTLRVGGIVDLGPVVEREIRNGIQWVRLANEQWMPEEVYRVLDEVLGPRQPVTWKGHIDQGDARKASAVARELFFDPPPVVEAQDDPAGIVAHLGSHHLFCSDIMPDPRVSLHMRHLVNQLERGEKQQQFQMEAYPLFVVGDDDMLAVKVGSNSVAFRLDGTLTIDHQTPPGGKATA